jgi:hypothetical protein
MASIIVRQLILEKAHGNVRSAHPPLIFPELPPPRLGDGDDDPRGALGMRGEWKSTAAIFVIPT